MTHLRWSGKTLWDFYFIKSDLWEWWRSNRNGRSSPLPSHPSPSFSILVFLIFLVILKSLTSDIKQLNDKHNIFSWSCSDVIEKDVRAAQSSAFVWLQSAHPASVGQMERQTAVVKHKFWGTKSIETPKLSLYYLTLTQRNSVLFLAVKVSVALVLNLNPFTDIGVRIECTVLMSHYRLSQQPKLLLFSNLFSPSPLQISGNLTVPWITGCSRKRAVSTFPFKYLCIKWRNEKLIKMHFWKCQFYLPWGIFSLFPVMQTLSAGAVFELRWRWCLKAGQGHNPVWGVTQARIVLLAQIQHLNW